MTTKRNGEAHVELDWEAKPMYDKLQELAWEADSCITDRQQPDEIRRLMGVVEKLEAWSRDEYEYQKRTLDVR